MKNRLGWVLCLSLAACGPMPSGNDGGSMQDAMASASIVGTWVGDIRENAAFMNRRMRLVLSGDDQSGPFTMQESGTGKADGTFAGCMVSTSVTGTYTASATTLSFTATSGSISNTGCTDAAQNVANAALNAEQLMRFNESGSFTLAGDSLTYNSTEFGAAMLTRQ